MRRPLIFVLASSMLAACGDSLPPVEVPPPPKATAPVAAEPPPEVSTSAEPRNLLVLGRWKAPIRGLDEVLRAYNSPISIEALFNLQDEAKLIELGGSVDFALTLDPDSTDQDPKVQAVFSIPLKSLDAARAEMEKDGPVTPVSGGALRISGKRAKKLGVCDLAPSTGDAAARLVCGPAAKDVDALRPWLTQGLPPAGPKSEIILTARAAPLRERYLDLLRKRGGDFAEQVRDALARQGAADQELLAVPGVLLDETIRTVEDIDSFDLRTSFSPSPPEVITTATLHFGAHNAWLTRVLTDGNDKPSAPPALFWRAPRDAFSVTWGHGVDPRAFDGVRRVLRKGLAEALAKLPLGDSDKGSLLALIDAAPRSSGVWVSAQGALHPKGAKPAKDAVLDLKPITNTALGWRVLGVEAPAAEYVAYGRQVTETYARLLRVAHDFLALAGKAGKGDKDPLRLAPKFAILTSPPGWPKGTTAFDLTFSSDLAELLGKKQLGGVKIKPGTVTVRLAVVPDGDKTWIGFAADADELKKRMNAVLSTARPDGTIASREGLEPLKADGQLWGGFVVPAELLDSAGAGVRKYLETARPTTGTKELDAALAALPNHGQTPILIRGTGTPGDKPTLTAEWRTESGSLADVAALVKFIVDSSAGGSKHPLVRIDGGDER